MLKLNCRCFLQDQEAIEAKQITVKIYLLEVMIYNIITERFSLQDERKAW